MISLPLWAEGGKSQIELADPYILLDGGKYYAYGTRDDNGIRCYSSDDLRSWKYEGLALHKDNTTESIFFWAPEVYHLGDKYIMYYSANQRLFVATGNSPKGGTGITKVIGCTECTPVPVTGGQLCCTELTTHHRAYTAMQRHRVPCVNPCKLPRINN